MKTTITKIGNLALGRIYGSKYDAMAEYDRTFVVSKDDFDLTTSPVGKSFKSNEHFVRFVGGKSYEVWGIKLGLKQLSCVRPTLYEEIADAIKESKEVPSHLIVKTWTDDDYVGHKETYTVHRLTQFQEGVIEDLAYAPSQISQL